MAAACERDPASEELRLRFEQRLARSRALFVRRREALPEVGFPQGLPIVERLEEVRDAIERHQAVVLCGETGSGKSTQLPKICLSLGRGVAGRIGHTQPRRIAARTLARRIAEELGQEVGHSVGFKVRFADRVNEITHVKLMTDGMLLAEIQRDRYLNEYDTLIIDEAHERSLNIDFLLGYLKQLLPKRPDLKVIVTSATIDPQRFSRHFDDAPVIEVSGRTYPVEVRYRPPPEDEESGGIDLQQGIVEAVDELAAEGPGDILIFFPGEREIREAAETLRKHHPPSTEILPLYARQSPAEQARIFHPGNARRIVLATNVAETSLTVPGIRYVIDTGTARISRYSARSKIQRLPVEPISQASADQRKGRCGRVAAGICIRLYSEEDFRSRPRFTEPEIQRTNLAAVILQMKLLGFGDIDRFPFVDPPDSRLIKDGYRVLHEIGAVDGLRKVTQLGKKLARLPIDPRIGRMLLEAAHTGCLRELLVIGAALSVQDPRDRPMDRQQQADEAHALFADERSDFMGILKLWDFLREKKRHLTRRKFERLCREHFISPLRVREWEDVWHQLREQLHEMGYRDNSEPASYEVIHQALLSGLLSHIGHRSQGKERDYLGARNTRFHIFPGSSQFAARPKWVVAAELVETTKLYARTVAQIQPEWVERLAGHLVKHHYSEPHWQARRGQVGAYEKVTLYGLPIVPRRRVNYGPIDPEVSREIFIRFGLVEGEIHTRAPFWRHNRQLIAQLHEEEAKARRRDILVDEEAIYAFYDRRIPAGIYSTAQLEQWLRKQKDKKTLFMRREDIQRRPAGLDEAQFPDALELHGARLPLSYHFEPGSEADGVTLHLPLPLLNQVSEGMVDWLVPGLLEEKLVAMIKGLPKQLRRQFVPAPDFARRARALMQPGEAPLRQALAAALRQLTGVQIPEDQWHEERLDPYLRMRIRLVSADGMETVAVSRDLLALQKEYGDLAQQGAGAVPVGDALEREGLRDWDLEALPERIERAAGNMQLTLWPALVDEGDSVALRCLDSQARAKQAHHAGVRRLLMLRMASTVRDLKKRIPNLQQLRLQYAKVPPPPGGVAKGGAPSLEEQILALAFDRAFLATCDTQQIRDRAAFEACYEAGRAGLVEVFERTAGLVADILGGYQRIRKALGGMDQLNWLKPVADMQEQLDGLVYQGFLQEIPAEQLQQYPRYLAGIERRIDRLRSGGLAKDVRAMAEMAGIQQRWRERDRQARRKGLVDPRLEEIRWMLEELRISLFAQEVKTRYPVSVKRIDKRWQELGL
ncbi:MAG: ATP-dependent RNA helicase HrpA [Gammaproteobacteria bacterium]|nr:MAG: ATP-dependent RNA helicase HrpA [Gammaproteobacteria bacterium]